MAGEFESIRAWIGENYPPPAGAKPEFKLAILKAGQLFQVLLKFEQAARTLPSLAAIPAEKRPEHAEMAKQFEQQFIDEINAHGPGHLLLNCLTRVLELDYRPGGLGSRNVIWADLLTIHLTYRHILPTLAVSPSFLLRLSMAEVALVELAGGVTGAINRNESPVPYSSPSRGGRISRGMRDRDGGRRETTAAVFDTLSESTRSTFGTKPGTVYATFLKRAETMDISWKKPPAFNTWRKWVEEHLSQ